MKKSLIRFVALSMAACMTVSLAACQKSSPASSSATSSEAKYTDPITVDVYTLTGNIPGEQTGWFAKLVKDKFNMTLNITAAQTDGNADTSFQTHAAAGTLGDIVIYGALDTKFTDSIKSNLLTDLSKDDLLTKHGATIMKNYSAAVKRISDTYGNYGIPNNVTTMSATVPCEDANLTYGAFLRYDIYQSIGSPVMNTIDDLYPTLKKMQAAHPKSETSGKNTYAFSLFKDWDGNMMMFGKMVAQLYGYEEAPCGGFYLINNMADKYQYILDSDSYYVKALKIYNQAYRDGLLDPDSISQTWNDITPKYQDDRILFSLYSWLGNSYYNTTTTEAAGKGFEVVPIKDEMIYSSGFTPDGGTYVISLGAQCKDKERCMDFIDWMYSAEGSWEMNNGPEGLTWELKDGKPQLTDFGRECLPSNTTAVPEEYGGGDWLDGSCNIGFSTIAVNSIDPDYNETYNYRLWSSVLNYQPSKLLSTWKSAMDNALDGKDYMVDNNQVSVAPGTDYTSPTLSTDIQAIQDAVKMDIRDASWKMVYAKTDAEFNSDLAACVKTVNDKGISKVLDFDKTEIAKLAVMRKAAASSSK